ncbi:MAG: glutamate--tRNA ligase [bacterium]
MEKEVRVRFAPSPTGHLHVGGLRTALYNYLVTRRAKGKFILRIEDTDQARKVEGTVENLIQTLNWSGIEYDEGPDRDGGFGPYIQSQRLALYRQHAEQLIDTGNAYYCFCTAERLDVVRQEQQAQKLAISYDRHCRALSLEESKKRVANGETHVIRMKIPLEGELSFKDAIRGEVTITYNVLDDQVIIKSDGYPTYHLAVVVDDHLMGITHIIRGEEWLPSVPKHVLLYQYFNWQLPILAHLPLLLNPDKSKLSKRQGDVAVEDYKAKGYLKEAILNFVAFLGWNPGDNREIFSLEQLIQEFSLERVGKSGSVFNIEKLNWLNQQYIKMMSNERLVELLQPFQREFNLEQVDQAYLLKIAALMKERVVTLRDYFVLSDYMFKDPETYDEQGRQKHWETESAQRLNLFKEKLRAVSDFTHHNLEETLKTLAIELQIKPAKLIHPTRLALSGKTIGPGLYEMMEILGKETVIRRLENIITRLS